LFTLIGRPFRRLPRAKAQPKEKSRLSAGPSLKLTSPELASFAFPAGILLLLTRLWLAAALLLAGLLARALVLLARFPGRLAGFLSWIAHSGSPLLNSWR
jgi:hypothetical protein